MKLSLVILLSLFVTSVTLSQEDKVDKKYKLYLEASLGLNRLYSSLESPRYFNNYLCYSKVNTFYGIQMSFILKSGVVLQTGLRYMNHNIATDSINIPPLNEKEVWSSFEFGYHSLNVPLKVGYQLKIGNIIGLRPEGGFILRFTGGHDYTEVVNQRSSPFYEEVPPANLYNIEKFTIAIEGGLTIIFLLESRISPFISGNYFTSTSYLDLTRGYVSGSIASFQTGSISEHGFLFAAGIRVKI